MYIFTHIHFRPEMVTQVTRSAYFTNADSYSANYSNTNINY